VPTLNTAQDAIDNGRQRFILTSRFTKQRADWKSMEKNLSTRRNSILKIQKALLNCITAISSEPKQMGPKDVENARFAEARAGFLGIAAVPMKS
jgi:hypothetical protein